MKTGRSIVELAQEIERQQSQKADYVLAEDQVQFVPNEETGIQLQIGSNGSAKVFALESNAHQQLGTRLQIPAVYYQRMLAEAPDLLVANANHWLARSKRKAMVRTLGGVARAILSDRYRRLDNDQVLAAVLPALKDQDLQVVAAEVTESRLYVKALFPKLRRELATQVGDIVQAGLLISNSEIGKGSLRIEPLIYRLICKNGAVMNSALKRSHVGRAEIADENWEILQDDTRRASDEAFWRAVRDVLANSLSEARFAQYCEVMEQTAQVTVNATASEIVDELGRKFLLSKAEKEATLESLLLEPAWKATQFGVANSLTRMAQEVESFDRSIELERIGGDVFAMSAQDFRSMLN